MVLMMPDRSILKGALELGFQVSNNNVVYNALLAKLRVVAELQVKELSIHYDLMLIVNQLEKNYFAHNPKIGLYLTKSQCTT
ncbi:hypothetical protein FF1_022570 [Malus domestica]